MNRPSRPPSPEPEPPLRRVAQAFPLAEASLLQERLLQDRHDRKYLLTVAEAEDLLHAIRGEYATLTGHGVRLGRYVTRYFDTPDLRAFHDHRRGRPLRLKIRTRDYLDRDLAVLEIKRRTGRGHTRKARRPRPLGVEQLDPSERAWIAAQTGRDDLLRPTLVTHFRRLTLLALHHHERLTVDVGLVFEAGGERVAAEGLVIIEVKSARWRGRSPAVSHLRAAGSWPRGFSKYCVGSVLLRPSLPDACFRRSLRAIRSLESSMPPVPRREPSLSCS